MTTQGKELIGRRVIAVVPLDKDGRAALGWEHDSSPGTVLIFDDRTWIYVAQDEEQNGPGALFHVGLDGTPKLVVPAPETPQAKAFAQREG